ncbi:hypothetical protein SUGI_0024600 [Cryptomeria japonica]|uniref:endochitinase n=1 Tax=Cryptomeria japonica TaxID=3369 RepID=UPI002408A607|nr:endochitinase [Cryptomeria japonica]GLJ05755.1 hypothetical protein SUGI_0024600 [Cryptomeria japonica]
MAKFRVLVCLIVALVVVSTPAFAENCGSQVGGAVCPSGLCCSQYGWCGDTPAHCQVPGCQSQCGGGSGPSPSGQGVASIITENVFNEMFKHRNDAGCTGNNFFNYNAFIAAANAFNGFGTTGDVTVQKRELAAFFAQTSHETTGGWATAPDGPYAWGYCFLTERAGGTYCGNQAPCNPNKQYYGRGPIQLTWNYNYIAAGSAIGFDGLNDPDIVARDSTISFKTAIWFWMTAQSPKPSCHEVITGSWTPSGSDNAAGRVAGYGMLTNIINGGLECGIGFDTRVEDRIGFYKRYCDILGVNYGPNLDCYNQRPYTVALPTQEQSPIIQTVV